MMAKSNLGRNKKKVTIVTLSFALSIVLLNSVYTYVTSFDFDKFVADFSLTDFTVSDTTVINSYAPYNTANVSQDFIREAERLNGLEDIGNIYLWTSKQPLSENDLARLQELSASSNDIANELEYQFRSRGGSGFCFVSFARVSVKTKSVSPSRLVTAMSSLCASSMLFTR